MASYACVEMEESKERDFVLVDLSVRLFEPHVIPPYSPSRSAVRAAWGGLWRGCGLWEAFVGRPQIIHGARGERDLERSAKCSRQISEMCVFRCKISVCTLQGA